MCIFIYFMHFIKTKRYQKMIQTSPVTYINCWLNLDAIQMFKPETLSSLMPFSATVTHTTFILSSFAERRVSFSSKKGSWLQPSSGKARSASRHLTAYKKRTNTKIYPTGSRWTKNMILRQIYESFFFLNIKPVAGWWWNPSENVEESLEHRWMWQLLGCPSQWRESPSRGCHACM